MSESVLFVVPFWNDFFCKEISASEAFHRYTTDMNVHPADPIVL